MTTLLIEHPISDYDTWRAAFDGFAAVRTAAGVTADRVMCPVDDDRYVIIQLDLPDADCAAAFLDVLRSRIWSSPDASPALRGEPRAIILEPAG